MGRNSKEAPRTKSARLALSPRRGLSVDSRGCQGRSLNVESCGSRSGQCKARLLRSSGRPSGTQSWRRGQGEGTWSVDRGSHGLQRGAL
jgi:hypothetical protein